MWNQSICQNFPLNTKILPFLCLTLIELEKGNEQKLPCCWTAAKLGHQILSIQGPIHRIDLQDHADAGSIVSGLDFDPIWPFWVWINTKSICVFVCSYRSTVFENICPKISIENSEFLGYETYSFHLGIGIWAAIALESG